MAEGSNTSGGGNAGLAFIVGALVVIVAMLAFFMFTGGFSHKKTIDINVSAPQLDAPKVPDPPKPAG